MAAGMLPEYRRGTILRACRRSRHDYVCGRNPTSFLLELRLMAISPLDTLDIAKRLKEAGFSETQAEAVTGVFREVRTADLANLATKADIERFEAATKADFQRLGGEIQRLKAATKADSARLEATMKADFQRLEDKMEIMRRDITIRLGAMLIAATAILLAARFFG
jgi:hypothetical protein